MMAYAMLVTGIVLLAHSYWLAKRKELPPIDSVERWLRTGVRVIDGDDENDNVKHTKASFRRVDAYLVLEAAKKDLAKPAK